MKTMNKKETLDWLIAQARKEERQKVLAEVEGWLVDLSAEDVMKRFGVPEANWYEAENMHMANRYADAFNKAVAELRAKLQEMKEGK